GVARVPPGRVVVRDGAGPRHLPHRHGLQPARRWAARRPRPAAAPEPYRAMTGLLSVRGLSVDFVTDGGVAQVLDGINLDVGPGEVVGLVGESGCGKTTLALRRLPHEFSGGQRQRLMIAMALLPQPDLIIADEPTTSLDVTIQAQILRLLRALVKQRGVSVLFTTHDLGTAHEICDRVVVMYAGQEMEAAPATAFFARAAHPYTRRLLASVPSPGGEIRDIPGEVPSLIAPPSGCRFHPRCDYATAECR